MRVAILDVRQGSGRKPANSYTVAYRNLMALSMHFDADLFVNASDIKMHVDYDVIVCGFGSTSCERDKSTKFLVKNKRAKIFWLVGEYEQSTFAPLFYSNRAFQVIKNFEHPIKNKRCNGQHFLNINTLLAGTPNNPREKKYRCVYYGRWRPDRLNYFQQYLDSSMYLSTHSKNIKMFHHNGCNPRLIKPLSWQARRETLNMFSASLYIEDVYTHTHYNCLANRFYESLMCNAVPLFDASCKPTLVRSGIEDWEWHIVRDSAEVLNKVNSIDERVQERMKLWATRALDDRRNTLSAIYDIFAA